MADEATHGRNSPAESGRQVLEHIPKIDVFADVGGHDGYGASTIAGVALALTAAGRETIFCEVAAGSGWAVSFNYAADKQWLSFMPFSGALTSGACLDWLLPRLGFRYANLPDGRPGDRPRVHPAGPRPR